MLFKLSEHASREREERLSYILMNVGIGEQIVCRVMGQRVDRQEVLTDSGVILILNNENKVITAYIATINKATAIWRAAYGNRHMTERLYTQIISNKKHYKKAIKIDNLYGYHIENEQYKFCQNKDK